MEKSEHQTVESTSAHDDHHQHVLDVPEGSGKTAGNEGARSKGVANVSPLRSCTGRFN